MIDIVKAYLIANRELILILFGMILVLSVVWNTTKRFIKLAVFTLLFVGVLAVFGIPLADVIEFVRSTAGKIDVQSIKQSFLTYGMSWFMRLFSGA